MKVALRSLLLAVFAALRISEALDTLKILQDSTRFTVDRRSDVQTHPYKIRTRFWEKGVKSIYSYTADGKLAKIVVGSKAYFLPSDANGAIKTNTLPGSRRALVEEDDVDTYGNVDEMVQEGAATVIPHRHLLTGYACEDCEDTMGKMCGIGLESVCNLVDSGYQFNSTAVIASLKTFCQKFGRACALFTAQEVCEVNQCVDSCGNTCGDNAECIAGTCSCLQGFTGNPTAGCRDPCNPTPCYNGGSCAVDIGGGHVCTCSSGFNGMSCQTSTADLAEFYIQLEYEGTWTTARKAVLQGVADRWTKVISHVKCGGSKNYPAGRLLIKVTLESDIPYDVTFGYAVPTAIGQDCGGSLTGIMSYRIDDFYELEASNYLEEFVLTDMGFVIGVGTLWEHYGCSTCPSTGSDVWLCKSAAASYNDLRGRDHSIKAHIIEDRSSYGKCISWDSVLLNYELMAWSLGGSRGLSKVTVASLEDIGYVVDPSQADEYILPSTRRSLIVADSPSKNLGFVRIPVETPIAVINEEGDVVGTVNGTAMRF